MTAIPPLKVRIAVLEEAQPVIDLLNQFHYDIGSVAADKIAPELRMHDARFLCVPCVDVAAIGELGLRCRVAFADDVSLLHLTNRVALIAAPLDTWLVVFLEIFAIEVPL